MKLAVVGSGIAGLSSAWLLSKQHDVTLFEAAAALGGHTNTVDVTIDGRTFPVDTGFLVCNTRTYPNLIALFAHLGVTTVASEMTFAVSMESPDLEWSGSNLATLFAQKRNLLRPGFWRMIQDFLRFNRETTEALPEISLGAYLDQHGYRQEFREWYLLPMAAAIWSCPTKTMLDYPLSTFVRFCRNHGLLQVSDRPQWLTVQGGGREYVKKLVAGIGTVRLATPVQRVITTAAGVSLRTAGGDEHFDAVVLACHSDQALAIRGDDSSALEREILGSVRYQPNRAVLHTDSAILPRDPHVWSAWNYAAGPGTSGEQPVSVSYLINKLQPLPVATPVIVTLNPHREPMREKVLAEFDYAHPVFDQAAITAQARLAALQGQRGVYYAGAWGGYGFHEDGLKSALRVANALGVTAPWQTTTDAAEACAA
jgi:predicted NAD/FAD-binding protein